MANGDEYRTRTGKMSGNRVCVQISAPMAAAAGCNDRFEVTADTVGEALDAVVVVEPLLGERVYSRQNSRQVQPFVKVFVDSEDAMGKGGLDAPLQQGASVRIVSAVAGG
jgi:ferredoxin-nitrite reductase